MYICAYMDTYIVHRLHTYMHTYVICTYTNFAFVCLLLTYGAHGSTLIYVTVSAKTVLNSTFSITRKTDLKYLSCCSSVVLDFSHARLTV